MSLIIPDARFFSGMRESIVRFCETSESRVFRTQRFFFYVTYKRKVESLRLFATRGNAAPIKGSISVGRGTLRSDRKRANKRDPLLLWGYQTMTRTIPTQSAIVQ